MSRPSLQEMARQVTNKGGGDYDKLVHDVQAVIEDNKGTLQASASDGVLTLKGTIETTYDRRNYNTPVELTLKCYPYETPTLRVVTSDTMLPYLKASCYLLHRDGRVDLESLTRWNPERSTLMSLIRDARSRFNTEAPLYTAAPGSQTAMQHRARQAVRLEDKAVHDRIKAEFVRNLSPGRVAHMERMMYDIAVLLTRFTALRLDLGGESVNLAGTLPMRYRNNTYHIPVRITIPTQYPRPVPLGLPQPYVTLADGMHFKQRHMHVDGTTGRVQSEYLQRWTQDHDLLGLAENLVAIFEKEPPVYSGEARPPAQQQQQQPQQHYQTYQQQQPAYHQPQPVQQQQQAQPAQQGGGGAVEDEILKKLAGSEVRQASGDDDSKSCVICYENEKEVLLIPCKHICMCSNCVRELVRASKTTPKADRRCPICRVEIMDVFPGVFF